MLFKTQSKCIKTYYGYNLIMKGSDATFSEIIRQLEYKSKYKGKLFYQIDEYYPSSQECNICGHIYKNINERTYKCSKCHHIQDRDLNASIKVIYER